MKAKTRTNQPVVFEDYTIDGDLEINGEVKTKGILNDGKMANNGDLTAFGNITGRKISGTEITELMSGYSFTKYGVVSQYDLDFVYAGVVKTGNKITFALAVNVTPHVASAVNIGRFFIPEDVWNKLFPTQIGSYNFIDCDKITAFQNHTTGVDLLYFCEKNATNPYIDITIASTSPLTLETKYYCRIEMTFLLSENLASD